MWRLVEQTLCHAMQLVFSRRFAFRSLTPKKEKDQKLRANVSFVAVCTCARFNVHAAETCTVWTATRVLIIIIIIIYEMEPELPFSQYLLIKWKFSMLSI